MANNRKMRKFEGTCYIPGEQLAVMAKYYRGANLNLNLTLVEDDMAMINESLENSCWCSKLDEVDRMKLQHMKGNEWKIQHDHHQERNGIGNRGSENCCFSSPNFPGIEDRPATRVDKGTETFPIYNQRPRRGYYDTGSNAWESAHQTRGNDYNGRRISHRQESPRRVYIQSQDEEFQRPHNTSYSYPVRRSSSYDIDARYRRNGDHEMEDNTSLWALDQFDEDIKCVVCKKDVCAVCKNPLRGRPCHCKCVIPNAGICNECDMQCDKESEKEGSVSVSRAPEQTQMNWSNLMLLMMSSQMLNRSQNDPTCKCTPDNRKLVSVSDSGSASGSSSCSCCNEKVQKIYLYDCESNKEANNSNKKKSKKSSSRQASSDSSNDCDCCKCSKKNTTKSPSHQRKRGRETTQSSSQRHRSELEKPIKESNSNSPSIQMTDEGESTQRHPSKMDKPIKKSDYKSSSVETKRERKTPTQSPSLRQSSESKSPSVQTNRERKTTTQSSSQRPTSESDKPTKYVKPSISPSKDDSPPLGKKTGNRHSSFRDPLEDNQSDSSGNEKVNKNKRRKVNDTINDDDGQSERISDLRRSPSTSTVDLNEFLVFLPKIKSDLEQLLTRLQPSGRKTMHRNQSMLVSEPYYTNVRTRSNVPFITNPSAYVPLTTQTFSQGTNRPPKFRQNLDTIFDSCHVQNYNIPSPCLSGIKSIFTPNIHNQKYHETNNPDEEQYHFVFPSFQSNKLASGTSNMTYGHTRNNLLLPNVHTSNVGQNVEKPYAFGTTNKLPVLESNAIHRAFQTSEVSRKPNEQQRPFEKPLNLTNGTSSGQPDLQNYNTPNEKDFFDHELIFNPHSFPKKLDVPVIIKSNKTTCSKTDITNEDSTNLSEKGKRVKAEGSSVLDKNFRSNVMVDPSSNGSNNAISTCKDLITFEVKPLNEPIPPVQSNDSKPTSDQFMSANEENLHFSDDGSSVGSELKSVFAIPHQEITNEFIENKTTIAVGPGQFKVSTFNSLDFKLPRRPSRKNHRAYNINKRKRMDEEDGSKVCPKKEDQISSHKVEVINSSLPLTNPTPGNQYFAKSNDHSVDMNASEGKAPINFTAQPNSVIALSETLVKTTENNNVVLSNTIVRTLNSDSKDDIEFYHINDQIESRSEYNLLQGDISSGSYPCGIAHSSQPSSEEDVNLPKLPTESIEVVSSNNGEECGSREKHHNSDSCGKLIGKDAVCTRHGENLHVAKFKLAQEAIQAMVQNMAELLASIDSDSESKITVTSSSQGDKERKSFFMHLERDERANERRQEGRVSGYQNTSSNQHADSCRHNPKEFNVERPTLRPQSHLSFSRHAFSKSQSEDDFKPESKERNYFLLDSGGSNSSVFTEKLRQSLANQISSPNLSAVLTPPENHGSANVSTK